ncbi:lamin tail domain-containing protein [Streptomyces carpinensis]|uniref:Lamin tail domain-containing protein n=1 Tax=Streptomyces carpinensis TaxID=66369 RepID=A0ABV1W2Z5_9ACTN|nr:lamin tail domain-containing protein [Streptomyces carpinensis]
MSVSVSVTARRLTAAVATAGALVGMATLPASAADHTSRFHRDDVVISSVHLDRQARDYRSNRALNNEWVEITNNTRHDVNLSGWTLSDEHGHTYRFRHYRLDRRATVRVHTGYGRDTRWDLYQDRRNPVWDRNADTATLRNDHERLVDAVSWRDRRHGDRDDHRGMPHHGDRHDHRGDRH